MAHRDTPNLPTPDFTFDPDATGACIAGVRPYRNSSYRLEAETISNRFFVHNYGHGGAGITLSWGCAAKVRDIIGAYLVGSKEKSVAVLGAGVMGLTAATRMLDLGLDVTIYSDRLPAQTTSAKAGASGRFRWWNSRARRRSSPKSSRRRTRLSRPASAGLWRA